MESRCWWCRSWEEDLDVKRSGLLMSSELNVNVTEELSNEQMSSENRQLSSPQCFKVVLLVVLRLQI